MTSILYFIVLQMFKMYWSSQLNRMYSYNHFRTPLDKFSIYIRLPVKYSQVIFSISSLPLKNGQNLSKASKVCLYFSQRVMLSNMYVLGVLVIAYFF